MKNFLSPLKKFLSDMRSSPSSSFVRRKISSWVAKEAIGQIRSFFGSYKILFISLGITFLFLGILIHKTHLLICDSESLPGVRISLVLKGKSYDYGDLVAIKDHPIKYGGKKFLVKCVAGLPGDQILKGIDVVKIIPSQFVEKLFEHNAHKFKRVDLDINTIDPELVGYFKLLAIDALTFPLLDKTRDGKPLNPLEISIVPEGCVFVAGEHPRSFDSRYQEFGLVHQSHVMGRALQLW